MFVLVPCWYCDYDPKQLSVYLRLFSQSKKCLLRLVCNFQGMKDLQHCCFDLLCHVLQISEKRFLTQFFPQLLMTFGSHLQPFLPSCIILRLGFMLATLIVNVIRKFVFIYLGAPGKNVPQRKNYSKDTLKLHFEWKI